MWQPIIFLHQELQEKLSCICNGESDEKVFAEAVFAAEAYRKRLYALIPAEGFADTTDEILFFKMFKPLFSSEGEFYQRLYHAAVFSVGNVSFYVDELKRIERLLAHNASFASYYHNGQTCEDHAWFAQGQAPMPTKLILLEWETDPRYTSARYRDWLKTKINGQGH